MDNGFEYETEDSEHCSGFLFRYFVYIGLTVLLGLQLYPYIYGQNGTDFLDIRGSFLDIKYAAMQLSKELSELSRKHQELRSEIKRISDEVPPGTAAAVPGVREDRGSTNTMRTEPSQALHLPDYDRQMADYALEMSGARVIDTGNTVEHFVYESPASWILYALSTMVCRGCIGATTMLQPGTLPGECWAFKTHRGEATIRLIGTVLVTGVSLEHIPVHISPRGDISSAPRLFVVEGLTYRTDPDPYEFGTFEYDRHGTPSQYFHVRPTTRGYSLVRLKILSNWGHPVYTCVYRFRVHGQLYDDMEEELKIENE